MCPWILLAAVSLADTSTVEAALQDPGVVASFQGVILVTDSGGDRLLHAVGESWSGEALDADSPLWLGSISKTIASATVLQLVSDGKLTLDDDVAPIVGLPESSLSREGRSCTVSLLLSHQCGLARDSVQLKDPFPWDAPESFLGTVQEQPLVFTPGTDFDYSNVGYDLVGLMVQAVDGRPYADAVHARVVEPLGLTVTRTSPVVPVELRDRFSPGHLRLGRLALRSEPWLGLDRDAPAAAGPSGMAMSTPRELDLWFRALVTGALVPEPWISEMLTARRSGYGLGVVVDEEDYGLVVWHNGALSPHGINTYVGHAVETGIQVTVLMPVDMGVMDATRVGHEIMDALHGEPMRAWVELDASRLLLDSFLGIFLVVLPWVSLLWALSTLRQPAEGRLAMEWGVNFGMGLTLVPVLWGSWSVSRQVWWGVALAVGGLVVTLWRQQGVRPTSSWRNLLSLTVAVPLVLWLPGKTQVSWIAFLPVGTVLLGLMIAAGRAGTTSD